MTILEIVRKILDSGEIETISQFGNVFFYTFKDRSEIQILDNTILIFNCWHEHIASLVC